jgi:hypothetical protein
MASQRSSDFYDCNDKDVSFETASGGETELEKIAIRYGE